MRGLTNKFMEDLKTGSLNCLLRAVQDDDTLCLEIRDNYVNIYYRGGNLCRIRSKAGGYTFEFDEKFARNNIQHKKIIEGKEDWSAEEWVSNIPHIKSIMNAYNLSSEREFQQLVLWENNRSKIANDTDYYIADIEHSFVIGKSTNRYIDMVAVKWPSTSSERKKKNDLQLALIEVKYGDKALENLESHLKGWHELLATPNKWEELCQQIEQVFNQKIELGLIERISDSAKISISREKKPELILLVINHKPKKSKLKTELSAICQLHEYSELKKRLRRDKNRYFFHDGLRLIHGVHGRIY